MKKKIIRTLAEDKPDDDKNFDYIYFARSYLILAFWGSEHALGRVQSDAYKNPLANGDDALIPDITMHNNYVLVPVLFNIKHAIEIFIKSTALFLGDKFEETHNLQNLFLKIKKRITGKKIDINNLETLILKYHKNEYLKDKIDNNFSMEDTQNDVFRYPDNKAKMRLDFSQILPRFETKDIKNIQADVKALSDLFYEVGLVIIENKYPGTSTHSFLIKSPDL